MFLALVRARESALTTDPQRFTLHGRARRGMISRNGVLSEPRRRRNFGSPEVGRTTWRRSTSRGDAA